MAMLSSLRAVWAFHLEMNSPSPPHPAIRGMGRAVRRTGGVNHNAALADGTGGALWLLTYLRRDATALGLLLLSMLDITSSFH